MDKKKLEKRLTIGFQIFALIGLIIIGFYLGKAHKARKENRNKEKEQQQEVIKDFGTKFESFSMEGTNDKKTIKFNGKDVVIENKNGVYLNDKKIDFNYVMGGYILDKTLILYSVGQVGYSIAFIDSNLSVIPFDEKDAAYTDLKLIDGKINANIYRYNDAMSCKYISGLSICNCEEIGERETITKYKDILEPIRDEVVTGTILLSYDGKNINIEYTRKETINDLYGSDLAGTTKKYCVENHNN